MYMPHCGVAICSPRSPYVPVRLAAGFNDALHCNHIHSATGKEILQ
ncbi:MAG: hypothetical protein QG629_157 [Patescibacteria group bacterium]|nr:hypothetical protein [Patescibacteria group bacterium]